MLLGSLCHHPLRPPGFPLQSLFPGFLPTAVYTDEHLSLTPLPLTSHQAGRRVSSDVGQVGLLGVGGEFHPLCFFKSERATRLQHRGVKAGVRISNGQSLGGGGRPGFMGGGWDQVTWDPPKKPSVTVHDHLLCLAVTQGSA